MKTQEKTLDILGASQDFLNRTQKALRMKKKWITELNQNENFLMFFMPLLMQFSNFSYNLTMKMNF